MRSPQSLPDSAHDLPKDGAAADYPLDFKESRRRVAVPP